MEQVEIKSIRTFISFKDNSGNVIAKVRLDAIAALLQSFAGMSDYGAVEFSKEEVTEKTLRRIEIKRVEDHA